MVGAKCFLVNRQRALEGRAGGGQVAQSVVHPAEVVDIPGDFGMVGAKRFLINNHQHASLAERLPACYNRAPPSGETATFSPII